MKNSLAVLLIFMALPSLACQFDTDCEVGSQCLKSSAYDLYGVCAGGMQPGNTFDQVPVTDSLDLDGTYGNTCQFDIDCGVSNVCLKDAHSLRGVCVNGAY